MFEKIPQMITRAETVGHIGKIENEMCIRDRIWSVRLMSTSIW